jgi:integrase/recombinase XerD
VQRLLVERFKKGFEVDRNMGDVHKRQERLEATTKKLKKSELSKRNTELVLQLKNHLLAQNLSIDATCRYLTSFNTLAPHIDFPLDEPDEEKLKALVGKINQSAINDKDYSVWTLAEFKKALKKFYKYHTEEDNPDIVDFMTVNVKKSEKPKTDPDELPTPSDVKKLVQTASNKRDETLIFLTWDTGGRIGEILNVKWKDIKFREDLTQVKFRESKTGERQVPIRESVETLREWRERHPQSSDPESYVFTKLRRTNGGKQFSEEQMTYSSANSRFRRISEQAGVNCKTNPHAFRKGRATNLASQGMNQAQLCEYFGWVQGSDQAATYIRMAEKDLDKAVRQIHGLEPEEEEEENLRPKKSASCETVNAGHIDYCKNCNELISSDVRLVEKHKENQVVGEVKDELVEELFDRAGFSEEERDKLMEKKMEEKMDEMEFFS